jgi:hypothetical protein
MSEFLISWDSLGVEAIVPIGEWREANIAAKLSGNKEPHNIDGTTMINGGDLNYSNLHVYF